MSSREHFLGGNNEKNIDRRTRRQLNAFVADCCLCRDWSTFLACLHWSSGWTGCSTSWRLQYKPGQIHSGSIPQRQLFRNFKRRHCRIPRRWATADLDGVWSWNGHNDGCKGRNTPCLRSHGRQWCRIWSRCLHWRGEGLLHLNWRWYVVPAVQRIHASSLGQPWRI